MQDDKFPQFVDQDFLAAMGMAKLADDRRDQALEDTLYNLNLAVGKRIADQLSEAQFEEFEALANNEDTTMDQMVEWHKKNVPNLASIIEEEAEKLKDTTDTNVAKTMARNQHKDYDAMAAEDEAYDAASEVDDESGDDDEADEGETTKQEQPALADSDIADI